MEWKGRKSVIMSHSFGGRLGETSQKNEGASKKGDAEGCGGRLFDGMRKKGPKKKVLFTDRKKKSSGLKRNRP